MKKLGNIIIGLLGVIIVVYVVFSISSNIVENFRLVTRGTVTQGIISSSNCGSIHRGVHYVNTSIVQFTDTQGRQQEAVAIQCDTIGIPFRQEGNHVSNVYLPEAPTIARIQGDLVLQFWLLEVPCLLIVLVVFFIVLFIFFTLTVTRLKRMQGSPESRS
jgi:hypothetical protein